jgi:hypothetical protein
MAALLVEIREQQAGGWSQNGGGSLPPLSSTVSSSPVWPSPPSLREPTTAEDE